MEGSVEDLGAPDSWEMADLDESMTRLMVSCKKNLTSSSSSSGFSVPDFVDESTAAAAPSATAESSTVGAERNGGVSDDATNQVDQFLREALQNPRERLSILRMEQDVEKFIRDPTQQQLEFQQLPTSYLRLAAHRVAQHYCLQSMVVLDNNLPDGSGSRIIVRKTSECRFPPIRLADIPISLPQEESNSVVKVAIKQRPQKRSQMGNSANSHSSKSNHAKSVEERKEEYNRARARIFSSNSTGVAGGRPESEPLVQDTYPQCSVGSRMMDEKPVVEVPEMSLGRGLGDSSTGSSRPGRGRIEKEPVGSRYKANSRVAIFRDREVDRKDPDYDRSYDRYMQRFDPGFGFSGGPYTMQPMYSPALNYNTEFPQLGSAHRPQISIEPQPRPIPQHLRGSWNGVSTPPGIGYGPPETMMGPFNPNHVGAHSTSAIYLHSSHYPCPPRPGMPFVNPHEHAHQPFAQPGPVEGLGPCLHLASTDGSLKFSNVANATLSFLYWQECRHKDPRLIGVGTIQTVRTSSLSTPSALVPRDASYFLFGEANLIVAVSNGRALRKLCFATDDDEKSRKKNFPELGCIYLVRMKHHKQHTGTRISGPFGLIREMDIKHYVL
ncbi:Single-stranded nucleic acid binding R3H [Macleaya cordata]|uniref:Single-stranded nucleic acid binding R3H n=1 Tax=Macleaya cordata TaxID=56857 RepID=A0A200Q676_MACCD|nr:Single-stranded nucleic acid binding R3H [Macleaya cordata]